MPRIGMYLERIGFYLKDEEYGWLSNFHRANQTILGHSYPTNEHYYQSFKAIDIPTRRWIAEAPSPFLAMKAGRSLREHEIVPEWDNTKEIVMLVGLKAKFEQNPDLAQKLLETGDAFLFEDSPTDMFWGGRLAGSKNMLGKLLMKVRSELKEGEQ